MGNPDKEGSEKIAQTLVKLGDKFFSRNAATNLALD